MRRTLAIAAVMLFASCLPGASDAQPGVTFDLYPEYVPKDGTPLAIRVSFDGLVPSALYDVRAAVRNYDTTGAMRFISQYWSWEHAEWRRSDWGSAYFRTDSAGRWRGTVLIRVNPSSSYFDDAIRDNATAFISVDYRVNGGSYIGWMDAPVLLLDMDAKTSNGTPGGWIHGYVMTDGLPVENATVLANETASGVLSGLYSTQSTGAEDYPLPATDGYYRVAVPEGGPYDVTVISGAAVVAQTGGIQVAQSKETHASINATPSADEAEVLMVELYPDTSLDETSSHRQSYGVDEYVKIHNPSTTAVDLSLWSLTDGVGWAYVPNGTILPPSQFLYFASNATAFEGTMGFLPDFEYEIDAAASVPDMIRAEKVPWFLNDGDAVRLNHRRHTYAIDVLVYGDATFSGEGWSGPGASLPNSTYVLRRYPNESSGTFPDEDSLDDWASWHRPRAGQSTLQEVTETFTGTVTAFVSPDSAFPVVAGALDNATVNASVAIYQLESPYIAWALENASNRGVAVRLLLEGGPVGGISEQQRALTRRLANAGVAVRFMVHDLANDTHNRYSFLHAKYAVLDGEVTIIGSENWKPTGTPVDTSYGNRGWGLVIHNRTLAYDYLEVFEDDWSDLHRDIHPFDEAHPIFGGADESLIDWTVPSGGYAPVHGALTIAGTFDATTVLAPDTSLSSLGGVLGLINSSSSSLDIAEFYIHHRWRDSRTGEDVPNAYLEAAVDAARRGVRVRILLDSFWYNVDEADSMNNVATASYVNGIAAAELLTLEARLVDLPMLGYVKLHTKGLVVDGTKTLVSSINWNRHSPTYNREVGVILESPEVAAYFTQVFDRDWGEAAEVSITGPDGPVKFQVGKATIVPLRVLNLGEKAASVTLVLPAPPDGWQASLETTSILLNPGAESIVNLSVVSSTPGSWDVTVAAEVANTSVRDTTVVSLEAVSPAESALWWILAVIVIGIVLLYAYTRRRSKR